MLLVVNFQNFSKAQSKQIIFDKNKQVVIVPIDIYRLVTDRQDVCDSIRKYNDELMNCNDSIVSLQKLKEQSFKQEISSKDTTIFKLINETNYLLKKEQESKSLFKNSIAWITGCVGLIIGVLITK